MDEVVTISQSRYEELLDIETRANVVVDMIYEHGSISTINLLRIIGTELALDMAEEIKKKMEDLPFGGEMD